MAEMEYVVSPYLQSAIVELHGALRGLVQREIREGATPSQFVFDALNRRAVALSEQEYAALIELRRVSGPISPLALRTAASNFDFFLEAELVLPVEVAFLRHRYECVEIEINRHCNFRCGFCPVKDLAKPRAFMSQSLFALVLDRVRDYGASEVSLHHYSEPTLDPELPAKVAQAAERKLGVRLHTNASLLDEQKIRALKEAGNISMVVVNLPTIDPDAYARITRSTLYERVLNNLQTMHRYGLPIYLSINVPIDSDQSEVDRINEKFASLFGVSNAWWTTSRAGTLDAPEYAQIRVTGGRLDGCMFAMDQVNVSFEGKVFLCCMDYHQTHVLGDLNTESLRNAAESAAAVSLRRKIFGYEEPPRGFICSSCEWSGARNSERLSIATQPAARALVRPDLQILISKDLRC